MSSNSLFEYGPNQWAQEPLVAFDAFLAGLRFDGRALRKSSFAIYRGMFVRLLAYSQRVGLPLVDLRDSDLELFLEERALGPETRHRYLLIFNTLFAHLASLKTLSEPPQAQPRDDKGVLNPDRALLLEAPATDREEPDFLTRAELEAFLRMLPASENWKKARTRALVYVIAGAGLRSSEALGLNLQDLVWKNEVLEHIWLQAKKPRPERKVPIQPYAREPIQAWVRYRQTLPIPGNAVFPSNKGGAYLQPVTLFREVKAKLEEAGISKRYEGATLLRNTCGALWLEHYDAPQVMQWMGHATLRTTELLLPPEKRSSTASTPGSASR